MYEKILVPLDGSSLAEVALPYAEELATDLGSEVTLIHICESVESQYRNMHRIYMENMAEATKKDAERYFGKPTGKPIKVKSALLVGHHAEQIVDYADKADIDLIVMATHGFSGIRRWVLGSVADKVVRATGHPVALIRATGARLDVPDNGLLNRALVCLDGSKQSEAVIPYVEELASKLKWDVVLFHMYVRDYVIYGKEKLTQLKSEEAHASAYIEQVAARLKQKGIAVETKLKTLMTHTEADEIVRLANEISADIVAMATHGRSGVGRWAFGSTTERVLQGANTPILLVRASGASAEQLGK